MCQRLRPQRSPGLFARFNELQNGNQLTKPNFEILAYEPTELGLLCLRRRELLCRPGTMVTEITLNHEFLMSSYLTASEKALSTIGIRAHAGENLQVLIGGLGLGYTASAALTSEHVASCTVVEYLPQVVEWMQSGLVPLSDELNNEERLQIVAGDIYALMSEPPARFYDLILIDVDHSPDDNLGDGNTAFYSAEGLKRAKQHLALHGVLGVWSYAESSPFVDALHDVFANVRVEPVTVENDLINESQTDWLFFAND